MPDDGKEGEFLTLSFLQELRDLCFKFGMDISDFQEKLHGFGNTLANPNLHDFDRELVGRVQAVEPGGVYQPPIRLMAACGI